MISLTVSLQGAESDEEDGSTNGEGDRDSPASSSSTQKSPLATNATMATTTVVQKSPANVPITAQPLAPEKSEVPPSSTATLLPEPSQHQSASDPTSISLPQNFSRVSKDAESTCARTDLVYVHPPPEEKPVSVPKVGKHSVSPLHSKCIYQPSTTAKLSGLHVGSVYITPSMHWPSIR